jgi:hypothetical protein
MGSNWWKVWTMERNKHKRKAMKNLTNHDLNELASLYSGILQLLDRYSHLEHLKRWQTLKKSIEKDYNYVANTQIDSKNK